MARYLRASRHRNGVPDNCRKTSGGHLWPTLISGYNGCSRGSENDRPFGRAFPNRNRYSDSHNYSGMRTVPLVVVRVKGVTLYVVFYYQTDTSSALHSIKRKTVGNEGWAGKGESTWGGREGQLPMIGARCGKRSRKRSGMGFGEWIRKIGSPFSGVRSPLKAVNRGTLLFEWMSESDGIGFSSD